MIKTYFTHNTEYNADDINTVLSSLASEGVLPNLVNNTDYTPAKLNELAGALATVGIADFDLGALKVSQNDGAYYVAPGKAFMADGCLVHNTNSIAVVASENTAGYIYLKYDTIKYEYQFVFSETALSDSLLLAQINADGSIIDKRQYSRTKLVPNSKNIYKEFDMPNGGTTLNTGWNGWNGMSLQLFNSGCEAPSYCIFNNGSGACGVSTDPTRTSSATSAYIYYVGNDTVQLKSGKFVNHEYVYYDGYYAHAKITMF